MLTAVVDVDDNQERRVCACDCGLRFVVAKTSTKIYFNSRHQQKAKDQRKKMNGIPEVRGNTPLARP